MDKIIILGHENPDVDSIVSGYLLEKILNKKGYNSEFIIPDKNISNDTYEICIKYNLDPNKFMRELDFFDSNFKYILVDHNERELNGEIICIIDHHPTGKNLNLEHYYNRNISSTACLIASNNMDLLNENDIKLAVIATLVDTVSFNSTKGRDIDKDWVIDVCNRYDFNYDLLYKDGLCLTTIDKLDNVAFNGLKKYNFNDKRVEASYIQIEKMDEKKEMINKILDILSRYRISNEIDLFLFIVYDMDKFNTICYLISNGGIEEKYYYVYASRGSTIIPEVEKLYNIL